MMRRHFMFVSVLLAGLAASGGPAVAQTFNSGSTGADGALNPTSNATIALLPSGVFNYTTVNIPTGVTVTFTKNVANTPVTILATGNVTIAGTIDVAGSPGASGAGQTILAPSGGRGGPGGFDGGSGANGILSNTGGTGLGPGGGGGGTNNGGNGAGAGFLNAGGNGSPSVVGGSAYGASALLPLIGGSGGGGGGATFGVSAPGGGGGGGALLIASSGTITFTGTILARGGNCGSDGVISGCGGGSGGGVRLVATTIAGSGGTINVGGGAGVPGSAGRIRIEGFTNTASINFAGVPSAAVSTASPTTATLTNPPTLSVTSVAGVASPATPSASFISPDITLPATTTNPVNVALSAANIPPGSVVTVRVQGQVGGVTSTTTTLAGSQTSSSATASLTVPTNQPAVISATTSFTVVAAAGDGPVFVQGEEIEQVRVSATLGGASQVAYVTKAGREIVVTAGR